MKLELVSLGCAAMVAGTAVVLAANASAEPLHILILHADEHRIDCLGAYGNKEIQTPHIDSLAVDGVRFNNSFCAFPVCTPSRYSLLSGLPVHEHLGCHRPRRRARHCFLRNRRHRDGAHPDAETPL